MKMKDLNLGEIIGRVHDEKGATKAQLALYLGIDKQNVNRFVFEKKSIDTDLLCKLCEFYDYNFFQLFFEDNQKGLQPKDLKATVTIEMGEQRAEKTFTISYGENKLKIE